MLYFWCNVGLIKKNVKFNFDLGENGDDEPDVGWSSGEKYKLTIVDLKIYIYTFVHCTQFYLVYLSYPNKRLIQGFNI